MAWQNEKRAMGSHAWRNPEFPITIIAFSSRLSAVRQSLGRSQLVDSSRNNWSACRAIRSHKACRTAKVLRELSSQPLAELLFNLRCA
jgi:hypothetical protein